MPLKFYIVFCLSNKTVTKLNDFSLLFARREDSWHCETRLFDLSSSRIYFVGVAEIRLVSYLSHLIHGAVQTDKRLRRGHNDDEESIRVERKVSCRHYNYLIFLTLKSLNPSRNLKRRLKRV